LDPAHSLSAENADRADDLSEVARQTSVGFGNELINLSVRGLATSPPLCNDLRAATRPLVPSRASSDNRHHENWGSLGPVHFFDGDR
jgi:hypothetical protein